MPVRRQKQGAPQIFILRRALSDALGILNRQSSASLRIESRNGRSANPLSHSDALPFQKVILQRPLQACVFRIFPRVLFYGSKYPFLCLADREILVIYGKQMLKLKDSGFSGKQFAQLRRQQPGMAVKPEKILLEVPPEKG